MVTAARAPADHCPAHHFTAFVDRLAVDPGFGDPTNRFATDRG